MANIQGDVDLLTEPHLTLWLGVAEGKPVEESIVLCVVDAMKVFLTIRKLYPFNGISFESTQSQQFYINGITDPQR
jgi:hypothetical protein